MLKFYVFGLAVLISTSNPVAAAQQEPDRSGNRELSEDRIASLAGEICVILQSIRSSRNSVSSVDALDRKLRDYGGVLAQNRGEDLTRTELAHFFNSVSHRMFCRASSGLYPTQHVFKRAVALNIQVEVLEGYFFADEERFPVNPNIVDFSGRRTSGSGGTTILDYIDSVLSSPNASTSFNTGQIRGLREILIDLYDAKTVADLPPEEVARQRQQFDAK